MGEHITDRIEIVNADCYTLLDSWPSDAALVTDPPYGISYAHSGHVRGGAAAVGMTKHANARGSRPIHGDAVPFDPMPFCRFQWVLLWGADHFRARLPDGGTMLAWDKNPLENGPSDTFIDGEFAWTNIRARRNVFRMLWKGLACDKRGEENGLRYHPTQKPQRLCAWCLHTLQLPENTLVIDPFMGGGSLGVACHKAGMRYFGVEIDAEYYATAKARLERETAQGLLL